MMHKFAPLGTLIFCGSALAQSVTIFGVMDAAVSKISATGAGHRVGVSSGSNRPSALGFRGAEDLSDGLRAEFWLEASLFTDTGGNNPLLFDRRSTLAIKGPLGELRLGRDFAPTNYNLAGFDPFGARGVGTHMRNNQLVAASAYPSGITGPASRNVNSISYFLPTLGGVYGQLQVALGEAQSTSASPKAGDFYGGRLGYASGAIDAAIAYSRWRQVNPTASATGRRGDLTIMNAAMAYNFGVAKAFLSYGTDELDSSIGGPSTHLSSGLVGATIPIGIGTFKIAYSAYDFKNSSNDFNKLAIGYVHPLSKRTQIYTTAARLNNKGKSAVSLAVFDGLAALPGVTPGGRSTGFDVGIVMSF